MQFCHYKILELSQLRNYIKSIRFSTPKYERVLPKNSMDPKFQGGWLVGVISLLIRGEIWLELKKGQKSMWGLLILSLH